MAGEEHTHRESESERNQQLSDQMIISAGLEHRAEQTLAEAKTPLVFT